ncbi:hypothetical protein [Rhizobium sp.]|jgi:hypothetical protein|uniref:hypothetical protein n=1 Tax=Rhizobium sp. TaxID=391 RepID=UPI000DBA59D1
MADHDDRLNDQRLANQGSADQAADKPGRLDDREERMLSEGRRLSAWALIGAAAFVIAMIALAFAVFKSDGPNPGAATSPPAVDRPSSEGP